MASILLAGVNLVASDAATTTIIQTTSSNTQNCSTLLNTQVRDVRGNNINLCDYMGKVVMIVNIASQGNDANMKSQYQALENLYQRYKDNGLVVLAFPTNDFQSQSPDSKRDIEKYVRGEYKVTFPMFDVVSVKGTAQSPLYQKLTTEQVGLMAVTTNRDPNTVSVVAVGQKEPVTGNFQKYLISREGKLISVFNPNVQADSSAVREAVERELQRVVMSAAY